MYAQLYLNWMINKDLRQSTGSSAQRYVAAWMGGELGGWMHVCVWPSPFAVHLNYHNAVNRLYSNMKQKVKKKIYR